MSSPPGEPPAAELRSRVVQRIQAPPACPRCGAWVCCELTVATGALLLHCGSTHSVPRCPWYHRLVIQEGVDEVILVSTPPGIGEDL